MASEAKHKKLVRVFFNTFYEDAAKKAIEELKSYGIVKVSRSKLVPELYFVELVPSQDYIDKLEELASTIENTLKRDDRIFGVKAYAVKT